MQGLTISERQFPFRVRADLQRAIDHLFDSGTTIHHFCCVKSEYDHQGITLSACLIASDNNPMFSVPPQHEEINIGESEPIRCLKNGLWFLEEGANKYVVLLRRSAVMGK